MYVATVCIPQVRKNGLPEVKINNQSINRLVPGSMLATAVVPLGRDLNLA